MQTIKAVIAIALQSIIFCAYAQQDVGHIPVAKSQVFVKGSMAARPIIFTNEGNFTACGYRIIVTSTDDGSKGRRLLDSLLILKKDAIFSKFDAKELPKGRNGIENLIPVKTYGGWFKVPGFPPVANLTEVPSGITPPPPSLHLVDIKGGLDIFDAISRGQPIHVAIRWEPYVENIYVGKVEITQSRIDEFNSCVDELMKDFYKYRKRDAAS